MNGLDELKSLLKENLDISKKIYKNTEKIKRHFFWTKIGKSIKFAVIIGLLIVGFIYSRPYLQQIFEFYKNVYQILPSLSETSSPTSPPFNFQNIDPTIINQIQKVLKK